MAVSDLPNPGIAGRLARAVRVATDAGQTAGHVPGRGLIEAENRAAMAVAHGLSGSRHGDMLPPLKRDRPG